MRERNGGDELYGVHRVIKWLLRKSPGRARNGMAQWGFIGFENLVPPAPLLPVRQRDFWEHPYPKFFEGFAGGIYFSESAEDVFVGQLVHAAAFLSVPIAAFFLPPACPADFFWSQLCVFSASSSAIAGLTRNVFPLSLIFSKSNKAVRRSF